MLIRLYPLPDIFSLLKTTILKYSKLNQVTFQFQGSVSNCYFFTDNHSLTQYKQQFTVIIFFPCSTNTFLIQLGLH